MFYFEQYAKKITQSPKFQKLVVTFILFSALLLGLETNQKLMAQYGTTLLFLDKLIISFFVFEIVLKVLSFGPKPFSFFKDGWNLIDFIIVVGCLVPSGSNAMSIFRLVRVLRVFRLVTALPRLQIIISALMKSIPSMGYVVVLLGIHFYMFGVLGTFLFGKNDPIHFGTLGKSFLSLFQVLTLEGWVDIMRIQIYGCSNFGYESFQNQCVNNNPQPFASILYFISFIVMGTMFILNLLIGAVVNGMAESQKEFEKNETDQTLALNKIMNEIREIKQLIQK